MKQINENRVSLIPYEEKMFLMKTFLNESEKNNILSFIENDLDLNLKLYNDNLILTERTEWIYHENEKFKLLFKTIKNQIIDGMKAFTESFGENSVPIIYNVEMIETWFAKCKKNGYTRPHNHGNSFGAFSYSCYLKLPSKTSSIEFANRDFSWQERIKVREGDILIFPTHLTHWSFDTEEERSLLSGNFILTCNRVEEHSQSYKND
jgi:hypothetical protein